MTGTGNSTILTEDDLLRTYDESRSPQQTVNQYRLAHDLREKYPDRTRASIARKVGRKPSVLRTWLVRGSKPPEIKAIEQANNYGWLPLHTDDRVFEGMNHLFAWVYAGGWINPDTFQPSLTVNLPVHHAVASHVIDPLANEWRSIRDEETDRPQELRPRDGGAILGRLLVALGAPKGSKATQQIALPAYLERVDSYYCRQFVRMYLLHRGAPANEDGRGLSVHEQREMIYFRELYDLFDSTTDGTVTLNESIPKIFLSTAAVASLAGDTDTPRQGLAYRMVYGEEGTLITERNFVNTYTGTYPNPWTVVQDYRDAMKRSEVSDLSESEPARDLGIERSKLRSWIVGGQPYALNGLQTATGRGWIDIEPTSDVFKSLNRLVAWIYAAGYLGESNMHPRFLLRNDVHKKVLTRIFANLELDYKLQKSETVPEIHTSSAGAVLGRVLFVLGVPVRRSGDNPLLSLPIYLGSVGEQLQRDFAIVYLLNRPRSTPHIENGLTLSQQNYPTQYVKRLAEFLQSLTEERVSISEHQIVLSTAALRALVPTFDPEAPDVSLANELVR